MFRRPRVSVVVALILATTVLAGCGGGGSSGRSAVRIVADGFDYDAVSDVVRVTISTVQ